MDRNEQFFGIVRNGQFNVFAPQHLKGNTIRLTAMGMQESQTPASESLDLSKYEGKIIEVSGRDSGGWIYSARVVEEAGPVLSDFLKKVFLAGEARPKRCALVVGHRKEAPGTVNKTHNTSEFEFNQKLARLIAEKIKSTTIHHVHRRTYARLPGEINELDPDFVINLHCGSGDGSMSGTSVLYHYDDKKAGNMGLVMMKHLVKCLGLPDRGIHAQCVEDECGYLLRYANAPALAVKAFYMDNDQDLSSAMDKLDGLAVAYAAAIDEIAGTLFSGEPSRSDTGSIYIRGLNF